MHQALIAGGSAADPDLAVTQPRGNPAPAAGEDRPMMEAVPAPVEGVMAAVMVMITVVTAVVISALVSAMVSAASRGRVGRDEGDTDRDGGRDDDVAKHCSLYLLPVLRVRFDCPRAAGVSV
jgi:hypothetical protein